MTNIRSIKKLVAFMLTFICSMTFMTFEEVMAEGINADDSENYVINLVVDGLSDKMYDEIKARGVETPNIDNLISNGSRLREVNTVIPSYGGSQAAALTGADTKTNEFLYRYYNRSSNSVINATKDTFNMKAQTIFEKFIEDNNGINVLATGWSLGDQSIDGRGVYKTGNENYVLKEYDRGDKLVSVDKVSKDIIDAINGENTPRFISGYSNDVKMVGWAGTDSTTPDKLDTAIKLIDSKVGEITEALEEKGIADNTTIILNSLTSSYTISSKMTTANLASKITSSTGVKAVESGGGAIASDAKVVVIKQYIMAYAQLYFTDLATDEDKEKVLEYLSDDGNDIGKNIENIYSYEELNLSPDYCDYLLSPIEGKTFSAASSGAYRTDDLHLREVFCIVSGNNILNGGGVKGDLSVIDIVPTVCDILGTNTPNNSEGTPWKFENISAAPTINVTYPSNNLTVYTEVINVTGTVDMESSVKVNGAEVSVDNNAFEAAVTLQEGDNTITIEATNNDGKTSKVVRNIKYVIKPEIPEGNSVVYINWDGFADYYFDLAEKQGRVPTLSSIKNELGVYFDNAYTGIPSITNPMQAAISSGTTAKYTGNAYRYYNKEQNKVIQESPGRRNEAETIAESVKRQGLNTVSINQFAFEDRGTTIGDEINPYVNADAGENGYSDAIARFDAAIDLVKNLKAGSITLDDLPRFIALYMDDLDGIGHNESEVYGMEPVDTEAKRIERILDRLEIMDKKLGELIEACKEAGIYDNMSFILTADHGMANFGSQTSPLEDSTVSKLSDLMKTIESLGEGYKCEFLHPTGTVEPSEDTDIAIVTVGLQAQISYIGEFDEAVIEEKNSKILNAISGKYYVGQVMLPDEMNERGVKRGFADLIISPKTPYHFHSSSVIALTARGQHDSLEEETQKVASFMWGNGIKQGVTYDDRIYNTDFASTMTELLEINAPLDSTGNIIYDALENSSKPVEYKNTVEAENAIVNGSTSKYFDESASGGIGVGNIKSEGAYIEYINVPKANKMKITYAADNDGMLALYVNGKIVRDIYFPETNSLVGKYEEKVLNIDLHEGDSVKFVFETKRGSSEVNFDKIDFYSYTESVELPNKTGEPYAIVMTPNGDTETSMGFNWYTDNGVRGTKVEVVKAVGESVDFSNAMSFTGVSETVGGKFNDENKVYESHKVLVNGLEKGTKYFYRLGDGTTWSDVGSFTTSDGGEFSFVFLTDSQGKNEGDYDAWAKTLNSAYAKFPDSRFVVMGGDMIDTGLNVPNNEQEWMHFFDKPRSTLLNVPMAPVVGNHEGRNNSGFANHFNLENNEGTMAIPSNSVYSFDYNDVHIAVLNTEMVDNEEMFMPQIQWLKRDMISTDKKWKIVVLHKAVYSTSSHINDKDILEVIKPMLLPVIDELGVDLVLQGHDHIYARTNQIYDNENTDDVAVDGKVENPKGTMYLINNTAGFKFYNQHADANLDLFAKSEQPNDQVYTGITVNNSTLSINSYLTTSDSLYDSYTIERSDVAPKAVEDFTVSISPEGVATLTWSNVEGAKEYVIYEKDNKLQSNWSIRVPVSEEKSLNSVEVQVNPSEEYTFIIKTVGERAYSEGVEGVQDSVKDLINAIDNLPSEITLQHKELVYALMDRYNNLSDKDKNHVTNINKLKNAVSTIEKLEEEIETINKEVNAIIQEIDGLPDNITLDHKVLLNSILERYNNLPEEYKSNVTNIEKLRAALEKIEQLESEAQALEKEIKDIVDGINKLPNNITLEHKTAVGSLYERYMKLSEIDRNKVSNASKLIAAKERIKELEESVEAWDNELKSLIEAIGKLPENITLENKETVDTLMNRYNNLPEEYKSQVNNIQTLLNAISKIKSLEDEITALEEEINSIIEGINKLPDNITLSNKSEIEDLVARYNKLSDDSKMKVTNIDKLIDAVNKINKLLEAEDNYTEDDKVTLPSTGAPMSVIEIFALGVLLLILGYAISKKGTKKNKLVN